LKDAHEMTLTLKRRHKHTAVTVHAIRQRGGVPYHVERRICSDCNQLLDEKTIRRAAA
jgi:RNase P subunit RPR2